MAFISLSHYFNGLSHSQEPGNKTIFAPNKVSEPAKYRRARALRRVLQERCTICQYILIFQHAQFCGFLSSLFYYKLQILKAYQQEREKKARI